MSKNFLIIQETPGHGEVIGGFLEAFDLFNTNTNVPITVYLLCGNSYDIFSLYEELGFQFIAFDRTNSEHVNHVVDLVRRGIFDLIIFNSSPDWNCTAFTPSILERAGCEVAVLHHSNLKQELSHNYIKLGTSNLLEPVTDFVFTPYYNVYDRLQYYRTSVDVNIDLGLLGTHYPSALVSRDIEKINKVASIFDDRESNHFWWFVAHKSDALIEAFGDKDFFLPGMSHLEIYKMIINKCFFWGTFYNKNTRYERDGMTGVIPFAVNASMPVLGNASFLNIYGFSSEYVDLISSFDNDVNLLFDLTKSDYESLQLEVSKVRELNLKANENLIRKFVT